MPITLRPVRRDKETDAEWAVRLNAYACALEGENEELVNALRSAEDFERAASRLYTRCVRNAGFVLDWADCVFDSEVLERVDEMATAEGRPMLKADEAAVLGAKAMRQLLREYLGAQEAESNAPSTSIRREEII